MTNELNVRVYVVEVPGTDPGTKLPYHSFDPVKSCCAYDPESKVHGEPQWVSVHTTEDHKEAVHTAKDYPRARVRQFWLARTITVRDTLVAQRPSVIVPDAQMTDMTCMDHPEVKLKWMPDGRVSTPVVCSICHKPLVTQALIDSMANPVDLSET